MNRKLLFLALAFLYFTVVKSEDVGSKGESDEFGSIADSENETDEEIMSSSGGKEDLNGQQVKRQDMPSGWPFPWQWKQDDEKEKIKKVVEEKNKNKNGKKQDLNGQRDPKPQDHSWPWPFPWEWYPADKKKKNKNAAEEEKKVLKEE